MDASQLVGERHWRVLCCGCSKREVHRNRERSRTVLLALATVPEHLIRGIWFRVDGRETFEPPDKVIAQNQSRLASFEGSQVAGLDRLVQAGPSDARGRAGLANLERIGSDCIILTTVGRDGSGDLARVGADNGVNGRQVSVYWNGLRIHQLAKQLLRDQLLVF